MPASGEVLAAARAHRADHYATCHANDGSGDTKMGKHMYPPAQDMRGADTQTMTDGDSKHVTLPEGAGSSQPDGLGQLDRVFTTGRKVHSYD